MCPTTLSGTGHSLMRFARGRHALAGKLRTTALTASYALCPIYLASQWTNPRTSPAYRQIGPTRSCFWEELYALALPLSLSLKPQAFPADCFVDRGESGLVSCQLLRVRPHHHQGQPLRRKPVWPCMDPTRPRPILGTED